MKSLEPSRYALIISVAAATLAGCGGAQPPIGASGAMPLGNTLRLPATESVVYSFAGGDDGALPAAAPISIGGEFYGTTVLGGNGGCAFVHGCGTVYKLNASGQERVLHVFKSVPDGEAPDASLVDFDGRLFGTTVYGGIAGCKSGHAKGCGTVFEVAPAGKERVLYRFPGKAEGASPVSQLTLSNGALFGEAAAGGMGKCYYADTPGCGLIFQMNASGPVSVVYTFKGRKDGGTPQGGLLAFKGNFYGTTSAGGGHACLFSYGCGTVFKMTPSGTQTILHEFGRIASDGALPESGLVVLKGALYGTTYSGGAYDCALSGSGYGCGTVFEVTLSGHEKIIYNFKGEDDGAFPQALIVVGGNLYGTTAGKGSYLCGTVFKMTSSGKETTLYQFKGGADGCGPTAGLINAGGTFYGTTQVGGTHNDGTVYAIDP